MRSRRCGTGGLRMDHAGVSAFELKAAPRRLTDEYELFRELP
jgi:hypothetical protein